MEEYIERTSPTGIARTLHGSSGSPTPPPGARAPLHPHYAMRCRQGHELTLPAAQDRYVMEKLEETVKTFKELQVRNQPRPAT